MNPGNQYPNFYPNLGASQSGQSNPGGLPFYSPPGNPNFAPPAAGAGSYGQFGGASFPGHASYGAQPGLNSSTSSGGGGGNVYNNNFYGELGAGLMTQMVGDAAFGHMGSHMFNAGQQLVNQNFGRFMNLTPLKYYFNVNNSYVMNKIKLLLCPFFHKSWKRRIMRLGEVDNFAYPREDINAPDLYIPTMAFVTYVLLVGFIHGTTLQFTPEILGMTASSALAMMVVELMFIKAGFYLFNCGNASLLDLVAFCGYKYVGVVINVLTKMVLGGNLYFVLSLYVGLAVGFFMIRTLRLVLVMESSRTVVDASISSSSKNYFLIVIAIFQIFVIYYLGYIM